jgi:hypothetical protein
MPTISKPSKLVATRGSTEGVSKLLGGALVPSRAVCGQAALGVLQNPLMDPHESWRTRWGGLTNAQRIERFYGFTRRWSWAIAIPMTLLGFGLIYPILPTPISLWRLVVTLLIGYLFFWGLMWFIGKKGPEDWSNMTFPNER